MSDAVERARSAWSGTYGERTDSAHRLVWGGGDFDVLLAQPAEGSDEPTRFGELAMQLWRPFIEAETRG